MGLYIPICRKPSPRSHLLKQEASYGWSLEWKKKDDGIVVIIPKLKDGEMVHYSWAKCARVVLIGYESDAFYY